MNVYELDELIACLDRIKAAANDARNIAGVAMQIGERPTDDQVRRYNAAISRIKLLKEQFYVNVENLSQTDA